MKAVTAKKSIVTGRCSELVAITALLRNGWVVAEPTTPEHFDLVARCPRTGRWLTVQVKTVLSRTDRNSFVVKAKKGDGTAYRSDEIDLFAAVLDGSRVFLFENRGLSEYWVSPDTLREKWVELT